MRIKLYDRDSITATLTVRPENPPDYRFGLFVEREFQGGASSGIVSMHATLGEVLRAIDDEVAPATWF